MGVVVFKKADRADIKRKINERGLEFGGEEFLKKIDLCDRVW